MVQLTSQTSGNVAFAYSQGADLPDMWIADSRFWMSPTFLGRPARLTIVDRSLASTPVLLVGGPRARYRLLGCCRVIGRQHPDPLATTAGALALAAPLAEAGKVGRTVDEARQILVPFAQDYGDRRSRGLDEQVSLESVTKRTRRVQVATEQDLLYATTPSRLSVVTPRTGAPVQRFVMALATGRQHSLVGEGQPPQAAQRVANDLAAYLRTAAGVTLLHEDGLRGGDLRPIPGSGAGPITPLRTPHPRDIANRIQSWRTAERAFEPPGGHRRLGVDGLPGRWPHEHAAPCGRGRAGPGLPARPRPRRALDLLDRQGRPREGLARPRTDPASRQAAVRPDATLRARARADELVNLTGGGTGLYDTTLAAYRQALRDYSKPYSNAVVLMTDGANDDPGSISRPSLIAQLKRLHDPERPVRIVAIGISDEADLTALRKIAAATGGTAFLARDPADIATVFARAVLSR